MCEICHDPFEQYWDEVEEDWHLKDAVRVDGKTYHPVCYEDEKEVGVSFLDFDNVIKLLYMICILCHINNAQGYSIND